MKCQTPNCNNEAQPKEIHKLSITLVLCEQCQHAWLDGLETGFFIGMGKNEK